MLGWEYYEHSAAPGQGYRNGACGGAHRGGDILAACLVQDDAGFPFPTLSMCWLASGGTARALLLAGWRDGLPSRFHSAATGVMKGEARNQNAL